jgi:hypothetical protein
LDLLSHQSDKSKITTSGPRDKSSRLIGIEASGAHH